MTLVRTLMPLIIAAVVVLSLPLWVPSAYILSLAVIVAMNAAAAESWNLLGGYLKQLNLATNAFVGLGAYAAAVVLTRLPSVAGGSVLGPVLSIIMAAAVTIGTALVLAPIFKRLGGAFFAQATLMVGLGLEQLFLSWNALFPYTGGAVGISVTSHALPTTVLYIGLAALALGIFGLSYWFDRSKVRVVLGAIREDEMAAEGLGINAYRYKVVLLIISAAALGVLGSFWAQYQSYIDPGSAFSITTWAIAPVIMAALGGVATSEGPIVGALILTVSNQYLVSLGQYRLFVYGVIIVFVIVVMPSGVVGTVRQAIRKQKGGPGAKSGMRRTPLQLMIARLRERSLARTPDAGDSASGRLGRLKKALRARPAGAPSNVPVDQ